MTNKNSRNGNNFILRENDKSPSYTEKSDNLVKGVYRPVSMLTMLWKLYESTMNDQFGPFHINFDKILSAFRKGHNCQTLLVE